MKASVIVLCLFVLSAKNLYSQKKDIDSSIKKDIGYIQVDQDRLYYEIAGSGEYIVLLHDGIAHNEVWDNQFRVFAEKYRVVRYDRRGYGRSTYPEFPFSHIEDLNQLFIQLEIPSAMIFGISGGGELALDFILKYPEKVKSLVLIGAVVSGYNFSSHGYSRGGRVNSLVDLLFDTPRFIDYFTKEDPYSIYPENIEAKEKFIKMISEYPNDVNFTKEYLVKPAERPAVNFLSEINVSTLVLVGEYDMPDIHAHGGVIEVGIPKAKREVILNSGHLIPLEQPKVFNVTVLKYLESQKFFDVLNSSGVNAAVQYFNKKRETEHEIILFDEIEMNILGYQYLQNGKIKEAVKLFKLNVMSYPNSSNVYDSLGEAFMKDGQTDLAIKNYEKSLKLNPNNSNAREIIRKNNGTK